MADTPQSDAPDAPEGTDDDQQPVERLQDHLAEATRKPDEMQARLDDLEEGIQSARRQAEADDLLPTGDDPAVDGPPIAPEAVPRGDQRIETPVDDAEHPPGG